MKPTMTLIVAVIGWTGAYAQLSHEDSLVLAEASPLAITHPLSIADSLTRIDSLNRADSLSRARTGPMDFPLAINAILGDFPNNLRHITGELTLAQGEFENYSSIVQLPGSENCTITRYHSADDTTVSWQAKMMSTEDFSTASKLYHELYRKLQRCYLRLVDGSMIYMEGQWEPAKEEAPFTTSTLHLQTGDWRYKDVKVEIELVFLIAEWQVNVNIITKKRDDEVGG